MPPYHLIYFQTLSIRLVLGTRPRGSNPLGPGVSKPPPKPPGCSNQQNVGVPLLSPSENLVGSIHLDTEDPYCPGSEVECLIMSRCFEPMANSALPVRGNPKVKEDQFNLFWVMYVVEVNGISERRGIGQVLDTALVQSCASGPQSRAVLLG